MLFYECDGLGLVWWRARVQGQDVVIMFVIIRVVVITTVQTPGRQGPGWPRRHCTVWLRKAVSPSPTGGETTPGEQQSRMASTHILIPDRRSVVESASEEEEEANNSSGSGSGNNSPTLGTSFFGKPTELGNERIKKVRQTFWVFLSEIEENWLNVS